MFTGISYLDLGIVDMRGNYKSFASLRGDRIENPLGGEDWFINAISKDAYISDIFQGSEGNPYFIAAVKLETDEETCVLKSSIDFSGLEGLVEDLGTGKSGTVCIINRKRRLPVQQSLWFRHNRRENPCRLCFGKYTGYSSSGSKPATFENNCKIYSISHLKDGDWLLFSDRTRTNCLKVLFRPEERFCLFFHL